MASIWKTLGLDGPTNDLKAIRRAYAKTLRTTRPDEDPEGFMALRQAFDRAKSYAAYAVHEPSPEPPEAPVEAETPAETKSESEKISEDPIESGGESQPHNKDEPDPISLADYLPDDLEPAIPALPPIEMDGDRYADTPDDISNEKQDPIDQVQVIIDSANRLLESGSRDSQKRWDALLERGHDLSLDEYNMFEHRFRDLMLEHFGYYDPAPIPPTGLKKLLAKRKPKTKPRLGKETAIYIFKSLGWNRWKSYPDYIQSQLLYLLYELGIKERPKVEETGKAAIFSEFRFILKALAVSAVFGVLAFITDPPDLPTPPKLPDTGESRYGSYSYSPEDGKWTYKLSNKNEKIKSLEPEKLLIDSFDVQVSDKQIMKVILTIEGQDGAKPTITHNETNRSIKTKEDNGLNAIFILIAGISFGFAFFRGFFFGIGLIIGLIGVGFGILGDNIRRLFRR